MGVVGAFIGLVVGLVKGIVGIAFGVVTGVVGLAFGLTGGLVGLAFGILGLVLQLAIIGGLVAGGWWLYKRMTSGGRDALRSGSGPIDMQYIRGRIGRGEYLRRKT